MRGISGPIAIDALDTQVGEIAVAVSAAGLVAVRWCSAQQLAQHLQASKADPRLSAPVIEQLSEYFGGARQAFDITVDWQLVSPIQLRVLETLSETVPFGSSVTYGDLAARSGIAVPARAVGGIMAANPVPIVVPCHRVLAVNGLGGFSGGHRPDEEDPAARGLSPYGLETKRWLLTFESVLQPPLGWDPAARSDPSTLGW